MPPPLLLRAGMIFAAAAAAAALRDPRLFPKLSQCGTLDVLARSPLSSSPVGPRLLPRCAIPRLARGWRTPVAVPLCSVASEGRAFDECEEEELKINAEEDRRKRKNDDDDGDDDDEDAFFNYGEPEFWDRTYAKENEPLEWYQSYGDMAPLVRRYIPSSSRVLMAGCGNAGSFFRFAPFCFPYLVLRKSKEEICIITCKEALTNSLETCAYRWILGLRL
jgi:hypothetical protein